MLKLRSTPMQHQLRAVRASRARPSMPTSADVFAYLAETGTGKSLMPLMEWQDAVGKGEQSDLLIVAPSGSIKNWYKDKTDEQTAELRKHLDPSLVSDLAVGYHEAGKSDSKRSIESLLRHPRGKPRVLCINVEAFSKVDSTSEQLAIQFLRGGSGGMIVVDESTTIRRESARTKSLLRVAPHARARRIMSGLVAPRDPLDVYWQFFFLDWRILGQPTFSGFRSRYADIDEVSFLRTEEMERLLRAYQYTEEQIEAMEDRAEMLAYLRARVPTRAQGRVLHMSTNVKSYKNLGELQRRIAAYSFTVQKKDCLDLPDKIYMPPRSVEMTAEQRRVYRELRDEMLTRLHNDTRIAPRSVLSAMEKLHQVACGHVRDASGAVHYLPTNRTAAVVEMLREHSGKAIVWSCYDPEIRRLVREIDEAFWPGYCAAYWGGNKSSRDAEERRYLSDNKCRVMVSTQASGGRGNTWLCGTLVVYAANSYDLEHRWQSEDRSHRRGQEQHVTYQDLLCLDTVEEKILHVLRRKLDLLAQITPQNYKEWLI